MTVTEVYSEVAERLARVGISNLPSLESMSERVEELVYKKKDGKITEDEAVELERYLSLDLLISLAKTKGKHMVTNGGNSHTSADYSEEEQALIKQIHETLPLIITQRCNELNHEQRKRKLTKEEQGELVKLIDTMEMKDVERLAAILELSEMWGVNTAEVRAKLNIKTPEPYVW